MFSFFKNFKTQIRSIQNLYGLPKKNTVEMKFDLHLPSRTTNGRLPYHCKEPIIFMHGIYGNRRLYIDDCKKLANYLQTPIYAVDARNHGDTENALPFNYDVLSNDLLHFIETHNLKKPSLIGFSLGAKIAMLAVLKNPQKFTSVVCVDNVPMNQPVIIPFLTMFSKSLKTVISDSNISRYDKNWISKVSQWMLTIVPAKDIVDYMAKNITNKPSKYKEFTQNSVQNSLYSRVPVAKLYDVVINEVPAWPEHLVEDKQIQNPMLFIRASKSGFIEKPGVAAIQKYFNNYKISSLDGTHLVMFERKQEYLQKVVEWFKITNSNLYGELTLKKPKSLRL
ncbi:hypothetical protein QEN19_003327 [Hanseniaspora menglaensis]